MNRRIVSGIHKWIGYILLVFYGVSVVGLIYYCAKSRIFPVSYLILTAAVLTIFGGVFLWMHRKVVPSIAASILTLILAFVCVLGSYYMIRTSRTITEVSKADKQTDVISVYVMEKDPAQSLEEIQDYQIGIVKETDRERTDQTVKKLENMLKSPLAIQEYEDILKMLDALKEGKAGAVILNDAYVGMFADVEGYSWIATDLRRITSVEHEAEVTEESAVPDNVPETFVMYLSGIDTYGGISARSRSDVNILAVVNTKLKKILLLSTPRDYYVDYNVTGGVKDKLTHAGIYGVEASMDALERLYGIQIDYYLRINFSGFVDIIDALGGIDVNSEYEFTVEPIKTYHVGINHLTGLEALAFARERYSFADGDYQRAKNQMEVIRAVVAQCASSSLLKNYASVMNAVSGSFETNMPDDQIASLVRMQLADMAQWEVTSYTSTGTGMYAETFSMPGQQLSVIEPDPASVEEAKRLIQELYIYE